MNKSELVYLDIELSHFYAQQINKFIADRKIKRVDLIGSHGQTIYHCDSRLKSQKPSGPGTWQIGNGGIIAPLTGIPVISDFRINDVALGGSGAPLTPICHYHLFADKHKDIGVLNLGGIANLTYLPGGCGRQAIMASDCGPGNMLVDQLMQKLYKRSYDSGGKIALSGTASRKLLNIFRREAWFNAPFPKSLGREQFGNKMIGKIMTGARNQALNKKDIITTVSELTPICVYNCLSQYGHPSTLIVGGGGSHNAYFMTRLAEMLPSCEVVSSLSTGIDPDYLEAVAFALLAYMFVRGDCANLTRVTGARQETVLGKLSLP